MIWVAWRQHRALLTTLALLLLISGGAVLLLHSSMAQDMQAHGLQRCAGGGGSGEGCLSHRVDFQARWFDLLKAGQLGVVALPVLLGVFVAAPLFAREIEHGTHVLAFTQSISRFRWMATKTAVVLLPSLVVVMLLQVLVDRWVAAAGELGPLRTGPFQFLTFDSTGSMPVVHLLFAFAAGALLGAALGRSLMAMTGTLVLLFVLRTAVTNLHLNVMSTQRAISPDPGKTWTDVRGVVRGSGYLDPGGRAVPTESVDLSSCTGAGRGGAVDMPSCYEQKGLAGSFIDVVPASAVTGLQLAEFAAFGIIAVLLLAGTGWTLQRQR